MIIDRRRDGFGFSLRFGIQSAHHTLQFGELLHHLCGQVALAEVDGAHNLFGLAGFQPAAHLK